VGAVTALRRPLDETPIEAEAIAAFVGDPVVVRLDAIEANAISVALDQRLARLVRMERRQTAERERLGLPRTEDDDTLDQGIELVHRAIRRVDRALGYDPERTPESEAELRAAWGDR